MVRRHGHRGLGVLRSLLSSPKSPSGRLGLITRLTGAPVAWPANGCISWPCTSWIAGVGEAHGDTVPDD